MAGKTIKKTTSPKKVAPKKSRPTKFRKFGPKTIEFYIDTNKPVK